MEQCINEMPSMIRGRLKKLRLATGLLLFLLAMAINVQAGTYSESVKFDLKMNKVSLKEVFQTITEQSEFKFIYNNNVVNDKQKVSVNTDGARVEEILDQILPQFNLEYRVVDRQVIVFPVEAKTETAPPTGSQQQKTITGKVVDEKGEIIPGVAVVVKGTTRGTITGLNGEFKLDISSGDKVIEFSFVGMKSQEVTIGEQSNFNITMTEDVVGIDEVVVVGYGTQRKVTSTGSVVTTTGEELLKSPSTNLSNNLIGRLPGLTSVTRSGEPGNDGATLRIRGSNTLGDNSPLVIVDGVANRGMERINSSQIESITILKDASAAIYGSQAANGVILITTKRGVIGKPLVSINMQAGASQPTRIPEMADAAQYSSMLNEINYYKNPAGGRNSKYSEQDLQMYRDGSDPWGHPNTDWFDEVYNDWAGQNQENVSLSGGTENMKYFISLGAQIGRAHV